MNYWGGGGTKGYVAPPPSQIIGGGGAGPPSSYAYALRIIPSSVTCDVLKIKVKVSHSLIAVGAVGARVTLYFGHRR